MPTSFLEIVELSDGTIVLRNPDTEESLVTLEFSKNAKNLLQGRYTETAKAMLNIGVQIMAGGLVDENSVNSDDKKRVIH